MKLINKLFIMAAAVSTLSGCRPDLLDTKPYDKASAKTMWTNENFCQLGINSIYSRLRSGWVVKDAYILESFGVAGTYSGNDHPLLAGTASPSYGTFSNYWGQHYYGVYLSNDAIQNLPNATIDDKVKGRMLAEAKTLRAFFYYKLNAVFKGVPYYDTTFKLDEAYKARETEATIWEKCIEDLTAAINEPNFPDRYKAGSAEWGHVNKSVAYALRGKVYLWTKEWAKAEADFRQLANLGCELFQGGYKQLFKEANEQSNEAIFSLQCIDGNGSTYGNSMSFRYGGRTTYGSCWNSCLVSTDFVESYENADGSKFDWTDFIPEYYTLDVKDREVFFLRNSDKDALTAQLKAMDCPDDKIEGIIEKTKKNVQSRLDNLSAAAQALYLPAGNEERLAKAYENRDPRLKQTVITPYSQYLGSASNKDHTYTNRWPYVGNDADFPWDVRTDTQKNFYYLFRKFVAEGTSEMTGRELSPIDLPIIRYGACLIHLAEALNEQGKTDEAVEVLNQVRKRAGAALLNSNEATKVNGQDDMRVRIQNEYRWETAGEGVNFFEEMRWNTWKEVKFHNGDNTAGLKEMWGNIIYPYTWGGDHYYKWAIPKKDTDMNPDLEQNPGWI